MQEFYALLGIMFLWSGNVIRECKISKYFGSYFSQYLQEQNNRHVKHFSQIHHTANFYISLYFMNQSYKKSQINVFLNNILKT